MRIPVGVCFTPSCHTLRYHSSTWRVFQNSSPTTETADDLPQHTRTKAQVLNGDALVMGVYQPSYADFAGHTFQRVEPTDFTPFPNQVATVREAGGHRGRC